MYRRASTAISSTGRRRPNGRVHWAGVGSCTAVFVHGRGPLPLFRDRQATPTVACPEAMAAARCATVAQEPPPPYPTLLKKVRSPNPTAFASSTSSVCSMV